MKITRSANSGVLLVLDGVKILLDGVCNELPPYLGTPENIRREFSQDPPDIFAVTHFHPDHCDEDFFLGYSRAGNGIALAPGIGRTATVGQVTVTAVDTRHIGKGNVPHVSYIINGSRRVWFMGDASPLSLGSFGDYLSPHLIIAPYAYANTPLSYKNTKGLGADNVIIMHLPNPEGDEYGILDSVLGCTAGDTAFRFPQMNETLNFD